MIVLNLNYVYSVNWVKIMSKILWDDLKTLYTELNTQRQKFQLDTVSVPSNQNQQTKTSDISTLKDAIQSMSSHAQIGDNASTASVIVPDQYSQMRQTPITQMRTVINRISQLTFNAGNFSGHHGTNFGGFHSGNFGNFDGSNFTRVFSSNNANVNSNNNANVNSTNNTNVYSSNHTGNNTPCFNGNYNFNISSHRCTSFSCPSFRCFNCRFNP